MIRIAAVLAALLLGTAALPAAAQYGAPGPGGSYQQSCANIHLRGNTLYANCPSGNGTRFQSMLVLPCRGDIANMNGFLRCNSNGNNGGGNWHGGGGGYGGGGFGGGGYGGNLPQGSYLQSCDSERINGPMLFARCPAPNGQRINSSMNVTYCRHGADIANRNGYLQCEMN